VYAITDAVEVSKSPLDFFATRLYKSMKGLGTNDTALIRLMISRSEIDLVQVKEVFKAKYKKTLYSFIKVSIACFFLVLALAQTVNLDFTLEDY